MDDELDAYVLATIEGPFGTIEQVSARMRQSEAAMSAASIVTGRPDTLKDRAMRAAYVKSVRVVILRKDVA